MKRIPFLIAITLVLIVAVACTGSTETIDPTVVGVAQQKTISTSQAVASADQGFTYLVVNVLFHNSSGERMGINNKDGVLVHKEDEPIESFGGGDPEDPCVSCLSIVVFDPGESKTVQFIFLVDENNVGLEYKLRFDEFPSLSVLLE